MESGYYKPTDPGRATGSAVHRLPLLPYERDPHASLDISEEEYRAFAADVSRRLQKTNFEGKPVAGAILVPLPISVVVGVVMSLLAPKPKQQEEKKTIKLGDDKGRSRYNESKGLMVRRNWRPWDHAFLFPLGCMCPKRRTLTLALKSFKKAAALL